MKLLVAFFLIFIHSIQSQAATNVFGVVFIDTNGNGIRDKTEAGLKGISVSDQATVVQTDANGFYQITNSKGYGYVFISMPQGYKAVRSFYNKINLALGNAQADFPLVKVVSPTQFKFIHASDTHVSDMSLDRMNKFKAVVDSIKPDFILVTGDLVKDALSVPESEASSLFELYKNEIQVLLFAIPRKAMLARLLHNA